MKIVNFSLFTEHKKVDSDTANIIDLFQEYVDLYKLVEVSESMAIGNMKKLEYKYFEEGDILKIIICGDFDLSLYCSRLKKFGYSCFYNDKVTTSVNKNNFIKIVITKKSLNESNYREDYKNDVVDLFQTYADEYSLKRNSRILGSEKDMNIGEYTIRTSSRHFTITICGQYDWIDNFLERIKKFGYHCDIIRKLATGESNAVSRIEISQVPTNRIITLNESKSDTLYIFDFDETLVVNPKFEDMAIEFLKEDVTIKSLLQSSLKKIGGKMHQLKWENGRLYIPDPDSNIDIKGNWVRKGKRVYLVTPDKFYFTDMCLPHSKTKLSTLYNSVDNKAIVTGRPEEIKDKVLSSLEKFGLKEPNHGLFCYPTKSQTNDKVALWKAKTIVSLIKKTGFKDVIFYDDNSKWVNKVTSVVKKELPDIIWTGIKYKHTNENY